MYMYDIWYDIVAFWGSFLKGLNIIYLEIQRRYALIGRRSSSTLLLQMTRLGVIAPPACALNTRDRRRSCWIDRYGVRMYRCLSVWRILYLKGNYCIPDVLMMYLFGVWIATPYGRNCANPRPKMEVFGTLPSPSLTRSIPYSAVTESAFCIAMRPKSKLAPRISHQIYRSAQCSAAQPCGATRYLDGPTPLRISSSLSSRIPLVSNTPSTPQKKS